MNEIKRWRGTGLLLVAGLLVACSDSESPEAQTQAPAEDGTASTLLSYVPESTPYVLANTEQIDDEVLDSLWDLVEPALDGAEQNLDRAREELAAKTDKSDQDRVAEAILSELDGRLNRAGLAELGIEPGGDLAFYGLGILPVLRAEVSDGERLRATIERIEQKAGQSLPRQQFGEIEYYQGGDKDAVVIVAVRGNQLIAAVLPRSLKDTLLPQILGDERPQSSLADSGRLQAVNEEFGLKPWGTLLIDSALMVEAILSDQSEAAQVMFGEDRINMDPSCAAEYRQLAGVAPRVVSGNTAITDTEIDQLLVMELRSDLALGLQAIKAAIPGLGRAEDGMFYLSLGLDLIKAKQFLADRAAAVLAEPYQCPELQEFNDNARTSQQQVGQPLPPFVANIRGLRLNATEVTLEGSGTPGFRGHGMVAMQNPQLILGMAQAFVPELANLEIGMDGTPVALPDSLSPVPLDAPHVAMTDQSIGFSIGQGEDQALPDYLSADVPSDPPLMSFGYDMVALAAYQQALMQRLAPDDADAVAASTAGLDRIDRVTATVDLTSRGIEVVSSTQLKP